MDASAPTPVRAPVSPLRRYLYPALIAGAGVLVTACAADKPREGIDFFPLTVDYRENFYAAGKIPGGFFKREGKPSEREVLNSRMIDRPVRPLFDDGFKNETQVIALVLSADPEIEPGMHAIVGASTALFVSNIPFSKPVGAVRVGLILRATLSEKSAEDTSTPTTLTLVSDLADEGLAHTRTLTDSEQKYRYRTMEATLVLRNNLMIK